MYLTQKEQKDLVVKKSANGKGIFTRNNFKEGQIIFQFAGQFISCDIDVPIEEMTRSNTIRFDADQYVSPHGRIGDFLNHSCEPNAKVVKKDKKLLIVAMSSVKKGDEVVIDYSTITASDDIWTMRCKCGGKECRGTVKQFQKLPKKLRDRYITESIVPKYILNL